MIDWTVSRHDWPRIITNLERAGLSQREIGERCHVSEGTTVSWANNLKNLPGTQPKLHNGLMLLGLWAEVCGDEVVNEAVRNICESNIPLTAAMFPHAAGRSEDMLLRPKCDKCGQALRGARAERWTQVDAFRREQNAQEFER